MTEENIAIRYSRYHSIGGPAIPRLYDEVRLLTDRFVSEGAKLNPIGYVIEIYDDGACEVEFSDGNGITCAQIVARPEELEVQSTP